MFEDHDKLARVDAQDWTRQLALTPGPQLVLFTAEWCSPCAAAEVLLCQVARQYAGRIEVWAIEHGTAPEIAERLAIRQVPCTLLYDGGTEIERFTGLPARQDLTARLTALVDEAC